MPRELDRREAQSRFMALTLDRRRVVMRSVNRGRAVPERALAPIAVAFARRQQRFWRVAWLVGPVFGLVQFAFAPWQQALVNAASGTVALAGMALWWWARARRAEEANAALIASGHPIREAGRAERGHLPVRPDPRPSRPRGRKRR